MSLKHGGSETNLNRQLSIERKVGNLKQTLLIQEFFQLKNKLIFIGLKLTYFDYFFPSTKPHLRERERLVPGNVALVPSVAIMLCRLVIR